MQLTDKLLLPSTILYTDSEQQSTLACSDEATRHSELTAEAGYSDVHNVTVPADNEDDAGSAELMSNGVSLVTVDNTAHPGVTASSAEANHSYAAPHQAGQNPTDTVSLMTMSLVNFPSQVHDTVHVDSGSGSALLEPLPTTVHVDGTLLHSGDTNIIITDSSAACDGHGAGQPGSVSLMSSLVSNNNDCSEVEQAAEWTRYLIK